MVEISCRADGKHYLALTSDGEVYSWGVGDGGRLGHGDNFARPEPTKIQALANHNILSIAAGGSYRLL